LSVCGYLVDTWCLGVKTALGPRRLWPAELMALRRAYFRLWQIRRVPTSLEFAQHLVLGAVEYPHSLGFKPHPDFRRARPAPESWRGPGAITFGRDGSPLYIYAPYDDPPQRDRDASAPLAATASLSSSVGDFDDLGDVA
jgi:hypothetical protein